ncbi:MAG: HEPN domain-containing protein [Anaerolineae bacterium]
MESERLSYVEIYLDLAIEKLDVAHELLNLSRFDDTVSKAYYAMFYAAGPALLTAGIVDVHKHAGVISFFGEQFVKTGKVDRRYSRILSRALDARLDADYDPRKRAGREDAEQAIARAEVFLAKAREIVAEAVGPEVMGDVGWSA